MAKRTRSTSVKSYPSRAADVPVTQRMLFLVRDDLKSEIKSLEYKTLSQFEAVKSELHQMRLLIEEQNARNNIVLDGLTSFLNRQV